MHWSVSQSPISSQQSLWLQTSLHTLQFNQRSLHQTSLPMIADQLAIREVIALDSAELTFKCFLRPPNHDLITGEAPSELQDGKA